MLILKAPISGTSVPSTTKPRYRRAQCDLSTYGRRSKIRHQTKEFKAQTAWHMRPKRDELLCMMTVVCLNGVCIIIYLMLEDATWPPEKDGTKATAGTATTATTTAAATKDAFMTFNISGLCRVARSGRQRRTIHRPIKLGARAHEMVVDRLKDHDPLSLSLVRAKHTVLLEPA